MLNGVIKKQMCVWEGVVYLICTVLVSPLSADASRDRHLIWGELRRLLAYWAYEQRQSHHNTVYNTHTMNYTSYAGKQWEFNILHWLYRQCHSFLHLFPSIIPPTATKHVYKSLLLWSSRVIRLSAIDWLAIKCFLEVDIVLCSLCWYPGMEREQDLKKERHPTTRSWVVTQQVGWDVLCGFPKKNEGQTRRNNS